MANGRKMIIVPEVLLRQIDEQRGDMERDEFIALCMDALLKGNPEEFLTPEEAEEDVFVIIPGNLAGSHPLGGASFRERSRTVAEDAEPESPPGGVEEQEEGLPLELWLPAVFLFGFGDTLTSALVFAKGGAELNPIMRAVLALPGDLWTFALVKTMVLAGLLLLGLRASQLMRWLIPLAVTLIGSYLVWNNILVFIGLGK